MMTDEGQLSAALTLAYEEALTYLAGLKDARVSSSASFEQLKARLGRPLGASSTDAVEVVRELIEGSEGGHLASAGGRFFAWVIGGALPSSLAADWLVSTWDNNAALAKCGPASAVIEEIAGSWIKEILRLPGSASFAFTTGCQMAHFTCLAAARNSLLQQLGWDVEEKGLGGAPTIKVVATEQRHGSIDRAVRFLGLGTTNLVPIETNASGSVEPETLRNALASLDCPTIVVLDAADLNVGAVDPFAELIPIARTAGAWVHVDGAFGLWARTSSRFEHLVQGVEQADSWATDAHKWLNTPKDIGIALVRNTEAHRRSMSLSASYISAAEGVRDQIDWTPDWTRRARGFPVYAALRELGREGVSNLIERCCDHAKAIVTGLGALPGCEVVALPTMNQGLVRFLDPDPLATQEVHDANTDAMVDAINRKGEAFFSGTTWKGRRAMRVSVVNWRTDEEDVRRTIDSVEAILAERGAESRSFCSSC